MGLTINRIQIEDVKGDGSGRIDDLIQYLQKRKEAGATHYEFWWSKDPMWAFKWISTFRYESKQEIIDKKQAEVQEILNEIEKLKNGED